MDTKSKKFDKLSIIKFICVFLSLVFAVAGSFNIVSFIRFLDQNDAYDAAGQALYKTFTGTDRYDAYYAFESKYDIFLSNAVLKSLLYPSDNDSGYKLYKKRVREKYCDEIENMLLHYKPMKSEYFIFYALDKGYITLKKLDIDYEADKKSELHYNNGEGCKVWYENPLTTVNDFECDFMSYDEIEEEYEVTTMPSAQPGSSGSGKKYDSGVLLFETYFANYKEFESNYYEEYSVTTNKNGAKLTEELYNEHREELDPLKCDAVVEINNVYYDGDYYSGVYGKHYSGIYEVFVNKENVDIYNPDVFYCDELEFTVTESDFSDVYNKMSTLLSGYKNMFFAVLDEETGDFYTNFSSPEAKKITADNVGDLMSGFCKNNYYKYTTKTNYVWDNSFQRYTMQEADYIRNRLPEDLNFTLWVGYDETRSGGDDAFSQPDEKREAAVESFKKYAPPTAVCALGWIICLIALIFISGRKSYDDELHLGRFDGIFTEIKTVLNLGLIALAGWAAFMLIFENGYNYDKYTQTGTHNFSPGILLIVYTLCGISSLLLLDWVLYLSRHIKNRTLLKNISVVRLIIFIRRKVKERKEKRLSETPEYIDFKKKLLRVTVPVLVVGNIILLIIILKCSFYDRAFLLLLPIFAAAEFFIIRYGMRRVMGIRTILDAIHGMRMGEADVYVDTGKMPSSLKPYANDVNSVSEGLSIAVEKATKEQRTRTELITNVSHDLKTPLTSIINYVDLLSKRPIEDEEAKKYVAVLGEKSEKLKKLIEDLVEASKASAGNVSVNLVRVSLHELVSQITGEYEDDFSKKGLTVFIEEKSGDITVSADSKLASRVLDNLMVNIRKYAMPGTRVYIRLFADGEYGCIGISNISEQQLNIPASELKERFVRGDKSRSTEGSGLGLAIAEDFMSLQNGKLDLFINGDMFTAVISFRIIPTQEEKN